MDVIVTIKMSLPHPLHLQRLGRVLLGVGAVGAAVPTNSLKVDLAPIDFEETWFCSLDFSTEALFIFSFLESIPKSAPTVLKC